jgi:hypothetical protein
MPTHDHSAVAPAAAATVEASPVQPDVQDLVGNAAIASDLTGPSAGLVGWVEGLLGGEESAAPQVDDNAVAAQSEIAKKFRVGDGAAQEDGRTSLSRRSRRAPSTTSPP